MNRIEVDLGKELGPFITALRFAFGTPKRALLTVVGFLVFSGATSLHDLVLLPISGVLIYAGVVAYKNGK